MTDKELTLNNLKIGYEKLAELVKVNSSIKEEFTMKKYGVYAWIPKEQVKNNICNTAGCLLGNLARCFNLSDDRFYDDDDEFNYYRFSKIVFPYLHYTFINIDEAEDADDTNKNWHFLFDEEWPDDFYQAMDRLKYFIDNNGDIGEWNYNTEYKI